MLLVNNVLLIRTLALQFINKNNVRRKKYFFNVKNRISVFSSIRLFFVKKTTINNFLIRFNYGLTNRKDFNLLRQFFNNTSLINNKNKNNKNNNNKNKNNKNKNNKNKNKGKDNNIKNFVISPLVINKRCFNFTVKNKFKLKSKNKYNKPAVKPVKKFVLVLK